MHEVVTSLENYVDDRGILLPDGTYSKEKKDIKKYGKQLSPGGLTRRTSSFWLPILLSLRGDIRNPVFFINLISRSFDEIEDCLVLPEWGGVDKRADGLHDLYNFYKGEPLEKFKNVKEMINTFVPAIVDPRRKFLIGRIYDIRNMLNDPKLLSSFERRMVLEHMKNMKDGMQNYLGGGMVSFDDLKRYCFRVASIPGKAVHRITDSKRGNMPHHNMAGNLGMALQLTNTIRDISGDLREGRSYLVEDGVYEGIENIREFLLERRGVEDLASREKESLKIGHDLIVEEFTEYAIMSLDYVFGSPYRDYNTFTKILLAEASMRMQESHIRSETRDADLQKVYFGASELEVPTSKRRRTALKCKFGMYNHDSYYKELIKPHIDYLKENSAF